MNSTKGASPKGSSAGGGAMDSFKGFLIMLLLLVLAGSGGYFFGTYQKFAPVRNVAPGTPGAVESMSGPATVQIGSPSNLKNQYWIHSGGQDRVGYAITVHVNGQLVDQFHTPNRDVEITRFVKPGENHVTFQAKSLPLSQRDTSHEWYEYSLDVMSGKKFGDKFTDGDKLVTYTRKVTETQDYNDDMTFVTVE